MNKLLLITSYLLLATTIYSQDAEDEKRKSFDKRILFVLDGSGSMKESWQGESKWEMAVSTLSSLIDSFQTLNTDFEIGIRVLGYQYPRTENRCDDSRLIIPFAKDLNFAKVNKALKAISPKGMTPLAYSIGQSEVDFPNDITAYHSIVLITDGLENCGGNPCEVSVKLRDKNIFINPYIIGLGIDSLDSEKLECIGKFIDAKNKEVFKSVVKNILTEVSVKTTLSVTFVNHEGQTIPYYVPYSLIDKKSKRDISNFIYTNLSKKSLDTISINPQYRYDLLVHTNPSMTIDTLKIIAGRHNQWIVPFDYSTIEIEPKDKKIKLSYILRDDQSEKSRVQGISTYHHLIVDSNLADLMEYPKSTIKIKLKNSISSTMLSSPKGNFKVKMNEKFQAVVFDHKWNHVISLKNENLHTYELNTGDYYLVYKREFENVEKSKMISLKIIENQTQQLAIP